MEILYLSGPMTGLPQYNYPAFEVARTRLEGAGYRVLSPTDNGTGPQADPTWHWYMRQALKQVLEAGAVATLPNAICSPGATLEVTVARALGMDIKTVEEWIREAAN